MSSSYEPDRVTRSHLDHKLDMLESRLKTEISMRALNLAMGCSLALSSIGFWVMIIVAIATDTKDKAGR